MEVKRGQNRGLSDSQNVDEGMKLSIFWAALHKKVVNTGTFTTQHLDEQVSSQKAVIASGGVITIINTSLGFWHTIKNMPYQVP